jgi:hypothetical protein
MRKHIAGSAHAWLMATLMLALMCAHRCAGQSSGAGASGASGGPAAGARGADTITLVTTSIELEAAIERGDAHIEIIEHLDLTDIPQHVPSYNREMFWVKLSTQSIQVRLALLVFCTC